MGIRAVRFSYVPGREAAQSRGTSVEGAEGSFRFSGLPMGLDPGGGSGLIATLQLRDVHLTSAWITPDSRTTGPSGASMKFTARQGDTEWYVEAGAPGTTTQSPLDNAGALCLADTTQRAPAGVVERVPHIRLAGLALGSLTVVTPFTVSGQVTFTSSDPGDRVSSWEFTEFLDDTIDVPPSRANLANQIFTADPLATQAFLGTVNGQQVFVPQPAKVAKIAAEGTVWTRPGQVGNAPNQIPTSVVNNNKTNYRFFPSIFFVRSQYIQALAPLGPIPSDPITTQAGSLPIVSVIRRPTHSRWLIAHDGQAHVVIIAHPPAPADYRTPLEIWSGFLNTLLLNQQPIPTYTASVSGGTRTFANTGRLRATFVDFVSFLEPLDDNAATSIFVPVTQT